MHEDEKIPYSSDPNKHVTKSHCSPRAPLKPDVSQVLSKSVDRLENSTCAYDDEFDSCFEEIDFRETDFTGKKSMHIDNRNVNEVIESGTVIKNNHKQCTGIQQRCSCSASDIPDGKSERKHRNQTEEVFYQEAASEKLQKVVLSKNNIGNKVNAPSKTRKIEQNTWSRYHSKSFKMTDTSQGLGSNVQLKTDLSGNNVLSCEDYYPFTTSELIRSDRTFNLCTKSVSMETPTVNINQVLHSFRSRAPYIFPLLQEIYHHQNLKTTDEEIK